MSIKNEWVKRIIFLFSCYLVLTALFTGLTLLHGHIPSSLTEKNMNKSLEILDNENLESRSGFGKNLPMFRGLFSHRKRDRIFIGQGDRIDNFANKWMVQSLDSEHFFDWQQLTDDVLPYNAKNRLPIEGDKNAQVFRSGWKDGMYWSGYRLFFKPLMIFLDVWEMRILQIILIATGAFWAFVSIRKNIGPVEAWLLIISLVAINPLNTMIDFYQGPDMIQALFSSVMVLWLLRHKVEEKWMLAYFLALGMIEIFINCLIMPLVTLGIPLMTWCLYQFKHNTDPKKQILDVINLSVAWGLGYVGTFMSCWIISALFTHRSVRKSVIAGFGEFFSRAGANEASIIKMIGLSIHNNINRNIPFLWLILLFSGILMVATIRDKRKIANLLILPRLSCFTLCSPYLPLLIVSAYPFLWITILSNHSAPHSPWSHDIFMTSLWGLLSISYYLIKIRRHDKAILKRQADV